jgi:hypothetical protein
VDLPDLLCRYLKAREWKRRLGAIPSVEALVEVDGVLAGYHLILAGAGAALPLRHLRSAAGAASAFLLCSGSREVAA